MSEYLFIGGPANGQTREVEDSAPLTRYVALPDAPTYATLTGRTSAPQAPPGLGMGAVIHAYTRRELRVADEATGTEYLRAFYVHESIQSAQHMVNALMQWLLGAWVMDGQQIQDGEVVSAEDVGSDSGS